MSTVMSRVMGDPSARNAELADVREAQAAAKREEQRLLAQVRQEEERLRTRVERERPVMPARKERRWIEPVPISRGKPFMAIGDRHNIRLSKAVTDAIGSYARIAIDDGCLWIEGCKAGDRYARRIGVNNDLVGASPVEELKSAGFRGRSRCLLSREPDGCWVARAAEPMS